jgi:hypothetical protein
VTAGSSPFRLRVLWISFHRIARYEEVSALLRAGFEVVPTTGEYAAFPNAVELPEERDPLHPPWRATCTIPAEVLTVVRDLRAYEDPKAIPPEVIDALDRWFDVVWVGTFPALAHELLRSYRGAVVLRPYGGFPYTRSLGWLPARGRALDRLASSARYAFCPALPYQALIEDPRLSRRETFWPACVTPSRLGHRWAAEASEPAVCEVMGLIDRYRAPIYGRFLAEYGDLPLRIFGQNPPGGPAGDDPRIMGKLDDDAFFGGIARCRVMLYAGLGWKYHLHYHPLEALMMGVPVVYSSSSAIAHTALWMGVDRELLREAGMCDGPAEARALCRRLVDDPKEAVALSARQELLRRIYRPEPWDGVPRDLVLSVARAAAYDRGQRDPIVDRPPAAGLGEGLVRLPRWIAGFGRRSWARLRGSWQS